MRRLLNAKVKMEGGKESMKGGERKRRRDGDYSRTERRTSESRRGEKKTGGLIILVGAGFGN